MKDQRKRRGRAGVASGGSDEEGRTVFQVVAAYDDLPSRNRALHLYHRIEMQLGRDYLFECSWWRFDHLCESLLREQAADEAAKANMIILSLRDAPDLPQGPRAWIDSWLPRRGVQKAALVALVAGQGPREESKAPLLPSIENVAREAQMDFFLHWVEPDAPKSSTRTAGNASSAPKSAPKPPESISSSQPTPRWGINE